MPCPGPVRVVTVVRVVRVVARRLSPLFFVFSHRLTSGSHPRETLAGGDDSVRVRVSRVRVRRVRVMRVRVRVRRVRVRRVRVRRVRVMRVVKIQVTCPQGAPCTLHVVWVRHPSPVSCIEV